MRWLSVDPGEDTGWAVWSENTLVESGTTKLWDFGDAVFCAVFQPDYGEVPEGVSDEDVDDWTALVKLLTGIERIVVEDWRLYPWALKGGELSWDQCRTARLIGSLTMCARRGSLEFKLQPAKIKERAEAAGAEALFTRPLHENRHSNDAIRHGIYYLAVEKGADEVKEATQAVSDAS